MEVFAGIPYRAIRGRRGDRVYKTYGDKVIVTRVPCFDGYVPTAAQRERREKLRAATAYAQAVYAHPAAKAIYVAAAKQLGRQPFRLAVADFLRGRSRVMLALAGISDHQRPLAVRSRPGKRRRGILNHRLHRWAQMRSRRRSPHSRYPTWHFTSEPNAPPLTTCTFKEIGPGTLRYPSRTLNVQVTEPMTNHEAQSLSVERSTLSVERPARLH